MSREKNVLFKAKAIKTGSYKNLSVGEYVIGYYVKCRGRDYILQPYNENGYDERWESEEWIEIDIDSLSRISQREYDNYFEKA